MTGLNGLREALRDYLLSRGINALCAFPQQDSRRETVAVVSLRACESGPAGFRDYLGELWDEKAGAWVERYGRRVRLTFGLDLYASAESGGEEAVRAAFDRLVDTLHQGGPDGLRLQSVSCGETAFDRQVRRYRCPAQAVYATLLWAEEGQETQTCFSDFDVKGEMLT
ncbi:hypothetical protein H7U37_09200 [Pseudoflavonifractor phocaeensis]|uniref:hypothetical protein n=1 Tax=Pseudoflavonifractor phocaeensis TaxID=1870988 RepID=UPI00195BE630|nr:hypothetical protein [Pseudoflavonifractor phocaeensis]MBM6870416.1 hypothetical protein [Pseudoflavonifractor phocaeensis]MBM6938698.1 hypothetical protein [Pseudoflavonifractor phocaeensis]